MKAALVLFLSICPLSGLLAGDKRTVFYRTEYRDNLVVIHFGDLLVLSEDEKFIIMKDIRLRGKLAGADLSRETSGVKIGFIKEKEDDSGIHKVLEIVQKRTKVKFVRQTPQ